MPNYYSNIKNYAVTLGLTTGFLWLIGGLLGVYFSKGGGSLLFSSAIIIGGLPLIITLIALKYNIFGALLLIVQAVLVLSIVYSESTNIFIVLVLCLSYFLPILLSGIMFIIYWYKNKIRV